MKSAINCRGFTSALLPLNASNWEALGPHWSFMVANINDVLLYITCIPEEGNKYGGDQNLCGYSSAEPISIALQYWNFWTRVKGLPEKSSAPTKSHSPKKVVPKNDEIRFHLKKSEVWVPGLNPRTMWYGYGATVWVPSGKLTVC